MIILEPDEVEHGIVLSAAQALDNDQYYAMLDSGTKAIIVPLHPSMQGEVAECQVPSATVTGPIECVNLKVQEDWRLLCQTQPSLCHKNG